jgi:hypothetical protein
LGDQGLSRFLRGTNPSESEEQVKENDQYVVEHRPTELQHWEMTELLRTQQFGKAMDLFQRVTPVDRGLSWGTARDMVRQAGDQGERAWEALDQPEALFSLANVLFPDRVVWEGFKAMYQEVCPDYRDVTPVMKFFCGIHVESYDEIYQTPQTHLMAQAVLHEYQAAHPIEEALRSYAIENHPQLMRIVAMRAVDMALVGASGMTFLAFPAQQRCISDFFMSARIVMLTREKCWPHYGAADILPLDRRLSKAFRSVIKADFFTAIKPMKPSKGDA